MYNEKSQEKFSASLNCVKTEFYQIQILSKVSRHLLSGGNITTYFLLNQCQLRLSNRKHLILESLINVQHQAIWEATKPWHKRMIPALKEKPVVT